MPDAIRSRHRLLVVTAVLVVAAVAGLLGYWLVTDANRSNSGGSDVLRSAGGPPTDGLDWQPCRDAPGQECAYFEVPASWSDPTGRTFRLHVRRLPARPTSPDIPVLGSIVINTGGPGIASNGYLFEPLFGGLTALRAKFHLVWPDPRGTGLSEPKLAACPQEPMLDRQEPAAGAFTWPQVANFRIGQQSPLGAECMRRNPVDGKLLGTGEVVQDFEALRQALGDEQLTYLGYSYGTRLGTQYARTYPDRVRAMVLDGSVDPSGTLMGLGSTLAVGDAESARFIRASLSPGMQGVYDAVEQRLRSQVINDDGVVTTRWTFGWDLGVLAAGQPSAAATDQISRTLCDLARAAALPTGPCPAPEPADESAADASAPPESLSDVADPADIDRAAAEAPVQPIELSPAKQLINCADLAGRPDAAALAGLMPPADQPDTPLPASFLLTYVPMCSGYPEAWAPIGSITTVVDGPEPLFVNGTADPATPIGGARAMQAFFPRSRMVAMPTAQHGVFPYAGSECVNAVVNTYLLTAVPPASDVNCPAVP